MINKAKKFVYLAIFGSLTSIAVTATYWQTSKYFQSIEKWKKISSELKK